MTLPLPHATLDAMSQDVTAVPGILGVALGGSRARGDALPGSDVDLGIYYVGTPDTGALSDVAGRWSGHPVQVGQPGSWGPWVDTGAWLQVGSTAVDWILRDLDRVAAQWERAQRGVYGFHPQAGHPLGFLDVSYVGELATSVILADPTGRLSALRAEAARFPPRLREALVAGVWEARFLLDGASKGARRADTAYVLQCLTRALLLAAHALHADAGRWVTNEKGLVPGVTRLPRSPDSFEERAAAAIGAAGTTPAALAEAVEAVAVLVTETEQLLGVGS